MRECNVGITGHSAECRARIERAMADDAEGAQRLREADDRRGEPDRSQTAAGEKRTSASSSEASHGEDAGAATGVQQKRVRFEDTCGTKRSAELDADDLRDDAVGTADDERMGSQQSLFSLLGLFEVEDSASTRATLEAFNKAEAEGSPITPGLVAELGYDCDLSKMGQAADAWKMLVAERPCVLIGGSGSKVLESLKRTSRNDKKYRHMMRDAVTHLKVLAAMYEHQHRHGRLFVHKQDWKDKLWKTRCVQELLGLKGIHLRKRSQTCEGLMSNSTAVLQEMLRGQGTTSDASSGGGLTCHRRDGDAVLQGLQMEFRQAGWLAEFESGGPTVEEEPPEEEWKETYHDEISGAVLKPEDVKEARRLEVEYAHKLRVYRESTQIEMEADGCKPIPVRWIDVNTGDADNVQVRSSMVNEAQKYDRQGCRKHGIDVCCHTAIGRNQDAHLLDDVRTDAYPNPLVARFGVLRHQSCTLACTS